MQQFQGHSLHGPYRKKGEAYLDLGCLIFFVTLLWLVVVAARYAYERRAYCLDTCPDSPQICGDLCENDRHGYQS